MLKYSHLAGDDFYLENGYKSFDSEYGDAYEYEDEKGLELEIAKYLALRPTPLTGSHFRFLRRKMGLSQEELATQVGRDTQTIARLEKSSDNIPILFEFFVRTIFYAKYIPEVTVERLNNIVSRKEKTVNLRVVLRKNNNGWSYSHHTAYSSVNTSTKTNTKNIWLDALLSCGGLFSPVLKANKSEQLSKVGEEYLPVLGEVHWTSREGVI